MRDPVNPGQIRSLADKAIMTVNGPGPLDTAIMNTVVYHICKPQYG